MGYDVIGDIHGQAGKLRALLRTLGYLEKASGWVPPSGRQAVFIGDLIDRGPEQVEVVDTVRAMIDAGNARCVLGNHEFNTIGYATPRRDAPGEFLRRHSPRNEAQHREFLRQVGEGSARHRELVDWFKSLPPTLHLDSIRAVHAWWHPPHVDLVAAELPAGRAMDDDFVQRAYVEGSPLWRAMEGLTKGMEIDLPAGHAFVDHGGIERHEVRTRWWLDAPRSYRDVAIVSEGQEDRVPDHPLPADYVSAPVEGAPVFVGHYWMGGAPALQSPRVACVDYSAARDGPLVAYRWDGEQDLDGRHFVAAA